MRSTVTISTLVVLLVTGLCAGLGFGVVSGTQFDESVVGEINDEQIATTNDRIEAVNDGLENVDDIEPVAAVEAETAAEAEREAERLREESNRVTGTIFDRVVAEINEQAGSEIAQDVESATEAREEAERIDEEYGEVAAEAVEALQDSAEAVEDIQQELHEAADTLAPLETGTVEGTVTDADGEPIADVDVEATETSGSATTDDDGTFALELDEGEQPLRFTADGYESLEETATVEADETTTVDVELSAESDDEDVAGEIFGSTVLDAGVLISGLALVGVVGIVGAGAVNRSSDRFRELLTTAGTATGLMGTVGVALGTAGYLSLGWVEHNFDSAVVTDVAPLIALMIVFFVAPVISMALGLRTDGERVGRWRLAGTTASALAGSVLLVVVALVVIGFATDSDLGLRSVVAIAGLVGAVSVLASAVALVLGDRSPLLGAR